MFEEIVEELVTLSTSELDAELRRAELDRRAAEARTAAIATVINARQGFRDDGHVSMRSYLKAALNCSGNTANRIRKRAALVCDHPTIGTAWTDGHIGTDQIDTLTRGHSHPRASHEFADFAPLLLDHAEHLEHVDLERCVEHFIVLADTDGAFDDQQFHHDERNASVTVTNGAVDVHATGGDPLAAAEIQAVFRAACEREFERDCATRRAQHGDDATNHPLPRTAKQRRFDAMHQIFIAWATTPANGTRPEPLVNIVIDHTTAGDALAHHDLTDDADLLHPTPNGSPPCSLLDRRCHTSTGIALHPDIALAAMIRGHVRRVVIDSAGVVVDLGRTRRLFTGKAREAAQLLATTCTHPGCDIPAEFCDVDHLDEWTAHHGPTDQHNAAPGCGHHNRHKHRTGLRARRTTDGRIRLLHPDGTLIGPAGEREPTWADETPARTA